MYRQIACPHCDRPELLAAICDECGRRVCASCAADADRCPDWTRSGELRLGWRGRVLDIDSRGEHLLQIDRMNICRPRRLGRLLSRPRFNSGARDGSLLDRQPKCAVLRALVVVNPVAEGASAHALSVRAGRAKEVLRLPARPPPDEYRSATSTSRVKGLWRGARCALLLIRSSDERRVLLVHYPRGRTCQLLVFDPGERRIVGSSWSAVPVVAGSLCSELGLIALGGGRGVALIDAESPGLKPNGELQLDGAVTWVALNLHRLVVLVDQQMLHVFRPEPDRPPGEWVRIAVHRLPVPAQVRGMVDASLSASGARVALRSAVTAGRDGRVLSLQDTYPPRRVMIVSTDDGSVHDLTRVNARLDLVRFVRGEDLALATDDGRLTIWTRGGTPPGA